MTTVFLLSAIITGRALTALETARVAVQNGVPVILLDGKPVRSRMFYGGPGGSVNSFDCGPDWKRISFVFQPILSVEKQATVHFRFGLEPGVVYLDNIKIEEIINNETSGISPIKQGLNQYYSFEKGQKEFNDAWTQWPVPNKISEVSVKVKDGVGLNGSKGLVLVIRKPAIGQLPDFHIYHKTNLTFNESKKYRISFDAKCEPLSEKAAEIKNNPRRAITSSEKKRRIAVAVYKPGASFTRIDGTGLKMFQNSMSYAKNAGAPFVNFQLVLPWPRKGKSYDFSAVDFIVDQLLRLNPDALLIPRIPMNAPFWWLEENPDHQLVWKGQTSSKAYAVATPSSDLYQQEAGRNLAVLIRHLEEKYSSHFAGYMPCGHNTGEWFYQDTWGPALNGYAKADTNAFRKWLRLKYITEDALRQSWSDPSVSFETADVPSYEYRMKVHLQVFNDVKTDPRGKIILDFNDFLQDMMADTVLHFAKICRECSHEKKLVVFFFGYLYEFARVGNGPAISGHYALSRLLKSPFIDILCSPISYIDRSAGGYAAAMTAGESVLSSGKLWLFEDDTPTHLDKINHDFPGRRDKETTLEKTQQLLLRNTAECSLRNYGSWWMDLFQSGWYCDPDLWKEMKRLEELDHYFLEHPTPFRPETVTFVDEKSLISLPNNQISGPLVYYGRAPFGRHGAPYGACLLDDLLDGKIDAKLNAFIGITRLTKEERIKIRKLTADKVNLWSMDAGYLDAEKGSDPQNFKELTGFTRVMIKNPKADIQITEKGKNFGLTSGWGKDLPAGLAATVTDAAPDEILAVYPDGKPAVVLRKTSQGGCSIFCGVPSLSSELIRAAAKLAGVHLFTEIDCNVYANGPFVVVHGAQDGPIILNTGKSGPVYDVLEKKTIGNGPKITIPLQKGETKIFRYE